MTTTRLSALDDAFLKTESPTAHMHVGWVAVFDPPARGPRPSFESFRSHIEDRLGRAPRYRQKLCPAPLGLDAPSWVDDEDFDIARHVTHSPDHDLDRVAAECMSRPLARDRPLWEICIADRLDGGSVGIVGKAHHCMVDGVAAVELALLLLDPTPEPNAEGGRRWRPGPHPGALARLGAGASDRLGQQLELARRGLSVLRSPGRMVRMPSAGARAAGAMAGALRPAEPVAPLNQPISTRRGLGRVQRPLAELKTIKQAFRATVNDAYLAIATGAMRRLLAEHGQRPRPLKAMVPVNVRDDGQGEELGNRISFMFVDLPCEEPDPGERLRRVKSAVGRNKRNRTPGAAEAALDLLGQAPRGVQRLASRLIASPHMFNLTVSNIPGPREPMYMLGCELREAYPVVPIPDRHALSIGMTTVRDRACFGLYADRGSLGDVHGLSDAVEEACDELLTVS